MLVLISPAKSLNLNSDIECSLATIPVFQNKIEPIVKVLKKLTVKKIEQKFDLSNKLSLLNHERFQNLGTTENIKSARQAIFTFDGEVYTGIDAYTIDLAKHSFVNKSIRILSGFYGILSPFDLIEPYRLEMGIDIAIGRKKNLYQYWSEDVTSSIVSANEPILNLASNEYSKVVLRKKLTQPMIDVDFLEDENGKLKNISFFSKKARGLMSRYIINNEFTEMESIKSFDIANYCFQPNLSSDIKFVFTRISKK